MAGAGYKLFNTGDVLTAQQVNEYLQQQTVMVFADASARTTALSSVLAEGMMSYLQDTNSVEVYNGSAWVGVSSDQIPLTTKGDLLTYSTTDTRLGVGTDGQVLTADSTEATGLKWATPSSGALTFTERKPPSASTVIYRFAYNGSNLYVGVGDTGNLWTSPNGQTWTQRTSGFGSNAIRDVYYGNGLFVAVGANGTITTSSDGITWTARTSNMGTNQLNGVYYANSTWVVVGEGGGTTNTGGITYSTDGITWTRKSQSITVGASYKDVTYNGTNWFIGAALSTNNYLYASTPSGTWTAGTTGGGAVEWCDYDGTRVIIQRSTDFYFTTSSTFSSWSLIDGTGSGFSASWRYYTYYNGTIYAITTQFLYQLSSEPFLSSGTYYAQGTKVSLNPTAQPASASPYVASNLGGIFVNATGIIISDGYGRIFTSF